MYEIENLSVEISKNYVSKDLGSPFLATRMAIIKLYDTQSVEVTLVVWIDCNKEDIDNPYEVVEIFTEELKPIKEDINFKGFFEQWKGDIEDYIGNENFDELMDY